MPGNHAILVAIALCLPACNGARKGLGGDGGPAADGGAGGAAAGATGAAGGSGAGDAGATMMGGAGMGAAGATSGGAGAPLPFPGSEASITLDECGIARKAVAPPLTIDADLACDVPFDRLHASLGTSMRAFVLANRAPGAVPATGSPSYLFTVDAFSGVAKIEKPTSDLRMATVFADSGGEVRLVGWREAGPESSLVFMRPMSPGWARESIVGGPVGGPAPLAIDAASSRLDWVWVLHQPATGKPHLAGRYANSVWIDHRILPDVTIASRLTMPDLNPSVAYLTRSETDGTHGVHMFGLNLEERLRVTIPGTPSVMDQAHGAISLATETGVSMIVPNGVTVDGSMVTQAYAVQPVPDTKPLAVTGCPRESTMIGGAPTPPTACTATGRGTLGRHALAATYEGTVWLAYVDVRIDRDATHACSTFEPGAVFCKLDIKTERSKAEVVLMRLPRSPTVSPSASDVVWRAPLESTTVGEVALSANGSHLVLAFSNKGDAVVPGRTKGVRMVVIDTTKL